jgi:hypothetical protein
MRIRHLKRKVGAVIDSVWPPQWTFSMHPRGGDEILVGDEGVLESVKRMGERLSLTMKYKGRERFGVFSGMRRHRSTPSRGCFWRISGSRSRPLVIWTFSRSRTPTSPLPSCR